MHTIAGWPLATQFNCWDCYSNCYFYLNCLLPKKPKPWGYFITSVGFGSTYLPYNNIFSASPTLFETTSTVIAHNSLPMAASMLFVFSIFAALLFTAVPAEPPLRNDGAPEVADSSTRLQLQLRLLETKVYLLGEIIFIHTHPAAFWPSLFCFSCKMLETKKRTPKFSSWCSSFSFQ